MSWHGKLRTNSWKVSVHVEHASRSVCRVACAAKRGRCGLSHTQHPLPPRPPLMSQESNKAPKLTVNLRGEVQRVACTDMKSFSLVLGATLGGQGTSKTKHKPGESLPFVCEDSKELTGWVNDLTAVVRAHAAGAHAALRM